MTDMERLLYELFDHQRFDPDPELQDMIDDTLARYREDDDSVPLDIEDLAAAAGGVGQKLAKPPDDGTKPG